MPNPWFRLYCEFADDPKVQMMPEVMQRRFVMLLCEKGKGETFHETERAFHWRVTPEQLAETKVLFIEKGFIDEDWSVLNWNKRQYVSDSSTERVRKYRQGKKQDETFHETEAKQPSAVTVTAPDTDTDTDTDTEKKKTIARQDVERIYEAYPRRVGKEAAIKAIEKALRRIKESPDWMFGRVRAYAEQRRAEDQQYTPHPATWFNQGRYLDESLEPKQKTMWVDELTGEPIQ